MTISTTLRTPLNSLLRSRMTRQEQHRHTHPRTNFAQQIHGRFSRGFERSGLVARFIQPLAAHPTPGPFLQKAA
jgi:hypothetical protein